MYGDPTSLIKELKSILEASKNIINDRKIYELIDFQFESLFF